MRLPTRWDVRAALASLGLASLLVVIACLVGGATDEGAVPWSTRLARTLPAVPLCIGAATFLTMRRASRRGESLALASIGCSPARIAAPSVVGAAAIAIVASIAVGASTRDVMVNAFLPRVASHLDVRVEDRGESGAQPTFIDESRGVHVAADGSLTVEKVSADATSSSLGSARATIAIVLAALGIALALIGARAGVDPHSAADPRLALAAGMCVLCIFMFHVAAAGRAPLAAACIPAAALLIGAAFRYRAAEWV